MLKRNRLGVDIFTRGMKGGIRSINTPVYDISLYELFENIFKLSNAKIFSNN